MYGIVFIRKIPAFWIDFRQTFFIFGKTKMFTFPDLRWSPPTVVARRWVDEWWRLHHYTDKWPNMARNSKSGPGAELWRFGLFGIESRLVRISNDLPRVVKLFSHTMISRRRKFFLRNHSLWMAGLDFSPMFFESRPLRYNFTRYQVLTIWNVFHPPIYIYTNPPKLLYHI